MPFRWTFSEQEELVHVVGDGPVDLTAMVEALFEVTGSAKYSPRCRVLVDLTEMEYEPEAHEAVEVARVLRNARSLLEGGVAVVAPDRAFDLAEMAASMASEGGLTIRAFKDPLAARAWLLSADPKV